jgi:hypothetical protein
MSNWSSYKKDKLIMESWRGFVNEETQTLTEQEINELLQEIGRMKNFLAKLRGAPEQTSDITGKGYGRGWEAALEKFDDEDAAKAAQQLKIPNVKSVEDLEARIKALEDRAEASGDPKVQQAAQELTNTIAQTEPPSDGAGEEGGAPALPSAGELGLNLSVLKRMANNPNAGGAGTMGDTTIQRFRMNLAKYLKGAGLPGAVNAKSPIVQAIVNVIVQAAGVANRSITPERGMGDPPDEPVHTTAASAKMLDKVAESGTKVREHIEKIFLPIILEEVKREKTRRILIEIAQKVAK